MLDNIIKNIIKYKSIKIVNFYPKHISWSYNTKSNSIMSYFIQHTIYKNNRNVFVINEPCIEITTESFKNLKKTDAEYYIAKPYKLKTIYKDTDSIKDLIYNIDMELKEYIIAHNKIFILDIYTGTTIYDPTMFDPYKPIMVSLFYI